MRRGAREHVGIAVTVSASITACTTLLGDFSSGQPLQLDAGDASDAAVRSDARAPLDANGDTPAVRDGANEGGGAPLADGGCSEGMVACADACVNLQSDRLNCGFCSSTCAAGPCNAGHCAAVSCTFGNPGADTACGSTGADDCCRSPFVDGGTYQRAYSFDDAGRKVDAAAIATVGSFRLDRYEITVGRFREFLHALYPDAGAPWRPSPGSGKHSHLSAGLGLADLGDAGGFEPGWTFGIDDGGVAAVESAISACGGAYTSRAGGDDARPMECLTWYEAYAFCIWDGAFLPSEGEWEYAAAGGNENRPYPWSSPTSAPIVDCNHANYQGCSGATLAVGEDSPQGDSAYGQSDLGGNVWEWALDRYADYVSPSVNGAALSGATTERVIRGGSFDNAAGYLPPYVRASAVPGDRGNDIGARCARTP